MVIGKSAVVGTGISGDLDTGEAFLGAGAEGMKVGFATLLAVATVAQDFDPAAMEDEAGTGIGRSTALLTAACGALGKSAVVGRRCGSTALTSSLGASFGEDLVDTPLSEDEDDDEQTLAHEGLPLLAARAPEDVFAEEGLKPVGAFLLLLW